MKRSAQFSSLSWGIIHLTNGFTPNHSRWLIYIMTLFIPLHNFPSLLTPYHTFSTVLHCRCQRIKILQLLKMSIKRCFVVPFAILFLLSFLCGIFSDCYALLVDVWEIRIVMRWKGFCLWAYEAFCVILWGIIMLSLIYVIFIWHFYFCFFLVCLLMSNWLQLSVAFVEISMETEKLLTWFMALVISSLNPPWMQ